MILSVQNVSKSFDGKEILNHASFHIEDHEKIALVGQNGSGKTTLLNMITGKFAPDDGVISIQKGATIGYLNQHPVMDSDRTIYEELLDVFAPLMELENQIREAEVQMKHLQDAELSAHMERYSAMTASFEAQNGYAYKSELNGVLKGLGFLEEEYDKKVNTLSGGQKTRVALGKILLKKPDLILLDEPTNHLDMKATTWLETYLLNYSGAVCLVSHDRYFLNRIVSKVVEVERTEVSSYDGNYEDFAKKKEAKRAAQIHAYLNQQQEIKHQQEVITKLKQFNREKSIKRAESREKLLAKVEVLDKPAGDLAKMNLELTPAIESGKDVLTIEHLAKQFDEEPLFTDLNFEIKRGEKVAIIGDNGTGKTTILKILNGIVTPDAGQFKLGSNVEIGYYDQEHHVLDPDKTIYDEIADTYPGMTITKIRNVLAAFLFTGDDVFKLIRDCSGGERGRISLAKLMLSNANFLILDEPTNHLDIDSKEILENALNNYTGTLLYVSHDRYFINQTASRILELENQTLTEYLGNYDYYQEKKAERFGVKESTSTLAGRAEQLQSVPKVESEAKLDWAESKKEQARIRKLENDLAKTESAIETLETKISDLETEMASPEVCTNVGRLNELSKECENAKEELAKLYDTWEEISSQLG